MQHAKPLPDYLVRRFRGWQATQFTENRAWYARLADEGQRPRAMIIACCDSRVHVSSVFGADAGEFFIHRNVANLVPPFNNDGDIHGTSAAIEYAVMSLKVANIILMGHSGCGGIEAYYNSCCGDGASETGELSFVRNWMNILGPVHGPISGSGADRASSLRELEKACVVTGLENLMTFPFVAAAVGGASLSLHGLWSDLRDGGLECYLPEEGKFVEV